MPQSLGQSPHAERNSQRARGAGGHGIGMIALGPSHREGRRAIGIGSPITHHPMQPATARLHTGRHRRHERSPRVIARPDSDAIEKQMQMNWIWNVHDIANLVHRGCKTSVSWQKLLASHGDRNAGSENKTMGREEREGKPNNSKRQLNLKNE